MARWAVYDIAGTSPGWGVVLAIHDDEVAAQADLAARATKIRKRERNAIIHLMLRVAELADGAEVGATVRIPRPVGRPPIETEARPRQIAIRLSDEEHARWSAAAELDGRALSDWVRRMVERTRREDLIRAPIEKVGTAIRGRGE